MGLERLLGMYLVKSIPVTNIAFQTKGLPLNVRGVVKGFCLTAAVFSTNLRRYNSYVAYLA